jgi:DNA invertase Pin-like site-specific DNA recombinase
MQWWPDHPLPGGGLHQLANRGAHTSTLVRGRVSIRPSPCLTTGGRLRGLDGAQQKRLLRLYLQGEPVSELTSMFGTSRSTLFRTLKVLKKQEPVSA